MYYFFNRFLGKHASEPLVSPHICNSDDSPASKSFTSVHYVKLDTEHLVELC